MSIMTTSPGDVAEAFAALIEAKWPTRYIYRDVCSADFNRPSFFLETGESGFEAVSRDLVQWHSEYLLTIYDEVDAFYVTSSERLQATGLEILDILGCGYIQVGDRAITMTGKFVAPIPGEAYIELSAEWLDARKTSTEDETAPLMTEFALNLNAK